MVHREVKVKTPTSVTSSRRPRNRHQGFTLVELLVVFAIAGLLIAVAPPSYERMREAALYRSTLRGLLADLRSARSLANAKGQWIDFEFDLNQPGYRWTPRMPHHPIPPSLTVRVTTGDTLIAPGQSAHILFLPDGGSSGGTIELLRRSGEGTRLRVDWLTGEIAQDSVRP